MKSKEKSMKWLKVKTVMLALLVGLLGGIITNANPGRISLLCGLCIAFFVWGRK